MILCLEPVLDWSTTIRTFEIVDECIFAFMTYERYNCKLVGVSKTVIEADNTQTVKIKSTLKIIFSNNKY